MGCGNSRAEQLTFRDRQVFRAWLTQHHARPDGLWLVFGKKQALETLTAEEALEEALCFGWIDGLVKRIDETRYIKYFSPRRKRSNWSEKNKATAAKLIRCGRMAAPGLQAVQRAKQGGTWETSQTPAVTAEQVEMFARVIRPFAKAAENYQKIPRSLKKQFAGMYFAAKQETTRQRRLQKLIGLLEQNRRPI
jgi:uncharacterized protein YdeI (YjbR/CyaY-like superfamily)